MDFVQIDSLCNEGDGEGEIAWGYIPGVSDGGGGLVRRRPAVIHVEGWGTHALPTPRVP